MTKPWVCEFCGIEYVPSQSAKLFECGLEYELVSECAIKAELDKMAQELGCDAK